MIPPHPNHSRPQVSPAGSRETNVNQEKLSTMPAAACQPALSRWERSFCLSCLYLLTSLLSSRSLDSAPLLTLSKPTGRKVIKAQEEAGRSAGRVSAQVWERQCMGLGGWGGGRAAAEEKQNVVPEDKRVGCKG